ncbi:hypothetical protein ICW40_06850, partial [Actinotalea ferrariae]|uniref:hypothetical protein n=1 Tax=Actinotalea ferrariae TaxID=1386098 RepID=UPI001C8BEB9F
AELPVRPDAAVVAGWWRARYRAVATESLARVAQDGGAAALHPFTAPTFLAALATEQREHLPRSRAEALRGLVGDLVPDVVVTRRSKAEFGGAFWGPGARAAAAAWDGGGVDPALVDPDALAAAWRSERPDGRTFTLLQHVWAVSGDRRVSPPR